jgi:hypothetical protein
MQLYNIDRNWNEVKKFLSDPLVTTALDLGMKVYAGDPEWTGAPWELSDDNAWDYVAIAKFEASKNYEEWLKLEPTGLSENELEKWYDSSEAGVIWVKYNELVKNYYPQPNTPDYYRAIGGGDFLGAFNAALGMLIASHLDWKIVTGMKHTTAIGYDNKKSVLCIDILWNHKSIKEILQGIRPILWRVPLGVELNLYKHILEIK